MAGEYRKLFDILNGKDKALWVTDGVGWHTTAKAPGEGFDHNNYLFNLTTIGKGILEMLLE